MSSDNNEADALSSLGNQLISPAYLHHSAISGSKPLLARARRLEIRRQQRKESQDSRKRVYELDKENDPIIGRQVKPKGVVVSGQALSSHTNRSRETTFVSQIGFTSATYASSCELNCGSNSDIVTTCRTSFQALSKYEDIGDQNYICQECSAKMWYGERLKKNQNDRIPKFGMCCLQGKVKLSLPPDPPIELKDLMSRNSPQSKHFSNNIRTYNMMFAFTLMGGRIDREVNNGRGPYVYRMSRENVHMIGSVLPIDGAPPKFAQLYIYDTGNEIANRVSAIRGSNTDMPPVNNDILHIIQHMLDEHNTLVQTFRMARDFINSHDGEEIKIKLVHRRGSNATRYSMPTCQNEIAALIVGDIGDSDEGRDIVVQYKTGLLERICETHPDFLPLQYPLLFPFGLGGYKERIPHVKQTENRSGKQTYISMREFFAYLIQDRNNYFSTIKRGGKLFQQFLVDGYMMIESYRLRFIRNNQKQLRAEIYKGLTDAVLVGETEASARGKRIILPSSFTGGARYTHQMYQDAMTICCWAGYPDLFITFTCNPKWQEITRYLETVDLQLEDCADIISRVFKVKLDLLMTDLVKGELFGPVKAALYTIEFQKRGLPHAHILLFLGNDSKIRTPRDIDRVICAEIPDKEEHPKLYEAVSNFMMHGPCGVLNPRSPCMNNGRCTKHFPKSFNSSTIIHEDGFPRYKRSDDSREVLKNGIPLDNRYVIPYNIHLLLKFQAHINIERCNQGESIKYLFKYVSKGHDRATAAFYATSSSTDGNVIHDEIKMYYDVRYLSPSEAVWRIFGFDINYRKPSVERLSFHLPDHQTIIYEDNDDLDDVLNRNTFKQTMFQAWMAANKKYKQAKELTYSEFPTKFVFKKDTQQWDLRKSGFSIGRLYYVPPGTSEAFYLRLLLTSIRGPESFVDIRTVDGVVHNTFRDACYAKGLLDDDKEYIDAIQEASQWASAYYLRRLFGTLLFCNCLGRPEVVWQQSWHLMADDIVYRQRQLTGHPGFILPESELHNLALIELETVMNKNGRSLCDYPTMPSFNASASTFVGNRFMLEEMNFDRDVLAKELHELLCNLTPEQKSIFDDITTAISDSAGGFFFVYGYGGSGKTYLWKTLSTSLRVEGKVVLNVASSGITSLLLPKGKTAHSQFAIPLTINEDSVCNIKQGTHLAELLLNTSLIIWDEAPMANKFCFEALDKTLRDITGRYVIGAGDKPFGGKVVVLGGDFRQILPVVPRGTREDIVFATINTSYLWKYCKVFTLSQNMRLLTAQFTSTTTELAEFAKWILAVGDGSVPTEDDTDDLITIPSEFLLQPNNNSLECIIHSTYPELLLHLHDKSYFRDRAILTSTLSVVDEVNNAVLRMLPGEEKIYLSADSVSKQDGAISSISDMHSVEFLNSISMSGLPNHELRIKVGAPIILMRNIDKSIGLCNGTRLIVTRLEKHVIEANIISGDSPSPNVLIARITITPSDSTLPFTLCRRQFPIMLAFAMTINKSQGQSLLNVGLYLPRPVFTHGQLYVAISRVRRKEGLKILILDAEVKPTNKTSNIVYKEVFYNLLH